MSAKIVESVCPRDCPDSCGMLSHAEDGRIMGVDGDRSDDVRPGLVASYMVRWSANANTTKPDTPADMGGNSTFHTNSVSFVPGA